MRPELAEQMNESMTGWIGRVRHWDYEDFEQPLLAGARRFEEGSHNMPGALAFGESLAVINGRGIENVWRDIDALTTRLCEGAAAIGWRAVSPRDEGQRSGIVALSREGIDPAQLAARLDKRGIHVAARRGWLRVSPHFYNQPEQIDRLLDELKTADD